MRRRKKEESKGGMEEGRGERERIVYTQDLGDNVVAGWGVGGGC